VQQDNHHIEKTKMLISHAIIITIRENHAGVECE